MGRYATLRRPIGDTQQIAAVVGMGALSHQNRYLVIVLVLLAASVRTDGLLAARPWAGQQQHPSKYKAAEPALPVQGSRAKAMNGMHISMQHNAADAAACKHGQNTVKEVVQAGQQQQSAGKRVGQQHAQLLQSVHHAADGSEMAASRRLTAAKVQKQQTSNRGKRQLQSRSSAASPSPSPLPAVQEAATGSTDWIGKISSATVVISSPTLRQSLPATSPEGAEVQFNSIGTQPELGGKITSYVWTVTGVDTDNRDFRQTAEGPTTNMTLGPGSYSASLVVVSTTDLGNETLTDTISKFTVEPFAAPSPSPSTIPEVARGVIITDLTKPPGPPPGSEPEASPPSESDPTASPAPPPADTNPDDSTTTTPDNGGSGSGSAGGGSTPTPSPPPSTTTPPADGGSGTPIPVNPVTPGDGATPSPPPPAVDTPTPAPPASPPSDGDTGGGDVQPPAAEPEPAPEPEPTPTPDPTPTPTPTPTPDPPPTPPPTPTPVPTPPPVTPPTPIPTPVPQPPSPPPPAPQPVPPPPPPPVDNGPAEQYCVKADYVLTDPDEWDAFNDCCNEEKGRPGANEPDCNSIPPRPATPAPEAAAPPPAPAGPAPATPAPTPAARTPDFECLKDDYDLTNYDDWGYFNGCCDDARKEGWDLAKYFPGCTSIPAKPPPPKEEDYN